MADNLTTATIDVRANTRGMERDILKALQTVELSQINTKKSSQALGRITGQVSEFNKSLEASNARVVAFGASAGAIFAVEKALSSLISSTIDVQKQLTDINVLLNLSSSSLEKFGGSLFDIARNTAQSFSTVAQAATELSRQGLGVEETLKRTNAALILTRLSGLDANASVETLTATLNSFSGSALDAVDVVNKLANVDAAFAVSSGDLANAISRVGSTAQDAGVSLDELIALVTSAQQTTARGGAVIGNSFKTIFTRLQRGKVQDLLGSLGIDTGEGQSAISLLQQLASTYDTLGAAQKSAVAEQVGGVFQINILKAALADLGKEYSVYGQALQTSLGSTDQAIRRNELLNKTVSAISSQTVASLEEAANKIGSIVFEPNAKGFLSGLNGLLESFNNIDSESAGGKLMEGFFKGVSNFIGGPGAVLATAVLVKLFARLGQFAAGSAKELLGTNKAAQQQAAIEQSILSILQKNSQFTSQILAGKMTTVQAEKQMLDYLTAQSNILREQERLSKVIGANLAMKGVSVGASGIPMTAPAKKTKVAASGYIPNFATDMAVGQAMENAGAREHGYKAGKAKKTTIHDGNGKSFKSFVNNKEDVKTFTNAAGKKATIVRPPNGFGENTQYAAGGFVPNFVKNQASIRSGVVFEKRLNKSLKGASSFSPNAPMDFPLPEGYGTNNQVKSALGISDDSIYGDAKITRSRKSEQSLLDKYLRTAEGRTDFLSSKESKKGFINLNPKGLSMLFSGSGADARGVAYISTLSKSLSAGAQNLIKTKFGKNTKSRTLAMPYIADKINTNALSALSSGYVPNFASMGSKFKAMYGGGTTMRAVDKEKSAKKKNLDVKKLDLSDRYTMVHGGNQGLDSANVSLEAGNKLFDAKIATAGLNTSGTNLQRYGIKGVVGDALVGATNNIIKTFGGTEQITDASSLDNAGSVGSAAGTVFETALRKSFNAPAISQTQRIDFPAPTPELRKFFHNAPGQYEAKISRTPDNLKSALKKWVDVNGLASSASGYIPNFADFSNQKIVRGIKGGAGGPVYDAAEQATSGATTFSKMSSAEEDDIVMTLLGSNFAFGGPSSLAIAGKSTAETHSKLFSGFTRPEMQLDRLVQGKLSGRAINVPYGNLGKMARNIFSRTGNLPDYKRLLSKMANQSNAIAMDLYDGDDKEIAALTNKLRPILQANINKGGKLKGLTTTAPDYDGDSKYFSPFALGSKPEDFIKDYSIEPAFSGNDVYDLSSINPSDQYVSKFARSVGSLKVGTFKKWSDPEVQAKMKALRAAGIPVELARSVGKPKKFPSAASFSSSGFVPNFAKPSGLSFSQSKKDEFGFSSINAILAGKRVGNFSYSEDRPGILDVGDLTVEKGYRGKGYGRALYEEAIKRNKGKKMKGQLLPQMNRLLQKIKNGEPVSAETLYPQIKRADLAKSSVFEVYGHKGMEIEKMTRDQFASFVNAKISELKKDPKKLQSYFGNVEADEYGGLGVDLQTQHASGFIPNFANTGLVGKAKAFGGAAMKAGLVDILIEQLMGDAFDGIINVNEMAMMAKGMRDLAGPALAEFQQRAREFLKKKKVKFDQKISPSDLTKTFGKNFSLPRPVPPPGFYGSGSASFASGGFIPNFSNALNDAIAREQSSGLSKSQIYVDKHSSLKNKNNPMGLMVANRRDEPGGGIQGIKRAKKEGRNAKTYGGGMSSKFVPNFAGSPANGPLGGDLDLIKAATEALKALAPAAKTAAESLLGPAFQGETSAPSSAQPVTEQSDAIKDGMSKVFEALGPAFQGEAGASGDKESEAATKELTKAEKEKTKVVNKSIDAGKKSVQASQEETKVTQASAKSKGSGGKLSKLAGKAKGFLSNNAVSIGFAAQAAGDIAANFAGQESDLAKSISAATSGLGTIASFASIGSVIPVYGTAIGAAVGATVAFTQAMKAYNSKLPELSQAAEAASAEFNKFGETGQAILNLSERYTELANSTDPSAAPQLIKVQDEYSKLLLKLSDVQRTALVSAVAQGKGQEEYTKILKDLGTVQKAKNDAFALGQFAEGKTDKKSIQGIGKDLATQIASGSGLNKEDLSNIGRYIDTSISSGATSNRTMITAIEDAMRQGSISTEGKQSLQEILPQIKELAYNENFAGEAKDFKETLAKLIDDIKSGRIDEAVKSLQENQKRAAVAERARKDLLDKNNQILLNLSSGLEDASNRTQVAIDSFIDSLKFKAEFEQKRGEFRSSFFDQAGAGRAAKSEKLATDIAAIKNQGQIEKTNILAESGKNIAEEFSSVIQGLELNNNSGLVGDVLVQAEQDFRSKKLQLQGNVQAAQTDFYKSGDIAKFQDALSSITAEFKKGGVQESNITGTEIIKLEQASKNGFSKLDQNLQKGNRDQEKQLALLAQSNAYQEALVKLAEVQNFAGGASSKDILTGKVDAYDTFKETQMRMGAMGQSLKDDRNISKNKKGEYFIQKGGGKWEKSNKGVSNDVIQNAKSFNEMMGTPVVDTSNKKISFAIQDTAASLETMTNEMMKGYGYEYDQKKKTYKPSFGQKKNADAERAIEQMNSAVPAGQKGKVSPFSVIARSKVEKELGVPQQLKGSQIEKQLESYANAAFAPKNGASDQEKQNLAEMKAAYEKMTPDRGLGLLQLTQSTKQTDLLSTINESILGQSDNLATSIGASITAAIAQSQADTQKLKTEEISKNAQNLDTQSKDLQGQIDAYNSQIEKSQTRSAVSPKSQKLLDDLSAGGQNLDKMSNSALKEGKNNYINKRAYESGMTRNKADNEYQALSEYSNSKAEKAGIESKQRIVQELTSKKSIVDKSLKEQGDKLSSAKAAQATLDAAAQAAKDKIPVVQNVKSTVGAPPAAISPAGTISAPTAPPTATPPSITNGIITNNANKPVSPAITAAPTIATNPDQVKTQQTAQIERANAAIAQKPSSAGNGLTVAENQAILKKWGYTQGEGFKNKGAEAGYKTEMEQIKQKRSQSASMTPAAPPAATPPTVPTPIPNDNKNEKPKAPQQQNTTENTAQLISNILQVVQKIATDFEQKAAGAQPGQATSGTGGGNVPVSVSTPVNLSINSTAGENKTEVANVADKIKSNLTAFLSSPEFTDRVTTIAKTAMGNPPPPKSIV